MDGYFGYGNHSIIFAGSEELAGSETDAANFI
jgi:hypothetical protein